MDFCVTTAEGRRFGLVKFEKRSGSKGQIEFYEWVPARDAWISIPLRLTLWAAIKNAILDGTWPPMFGRDMVATPDGFELAFNSNNYDPPDYRWLARYSARTGKFILERGAKIG